MQRNARNMMDQLQYSATPSDFDGEGQVRVGLVAARIVLDVLHCGTLDHGPLVALDVVVHLDLLHVNSTRECTYDGRCESGKLTSFPL